MKYLLHYVIHPGGAFGVPDEHGDKMPVPSAAFDSGDVASPTFESSTLTKVGHGQLPIYRDPDDAVHERLVIGGSMAEIRDNYLILQVGADSPSDATVKGRSLVSAFLRRLMMTKPEFYYATPILIRTEDGAARRVEQPVQVLSLQVYDFPTLREGLSEAARWSDYSDERLAKALTYYEHALFLRNLLGEVDDLQMRSHHASYMGTSIFLHLWKAITTLIGDPTEREYQTQWRTIGLRQEDKDVIDELKRLRNNFDVAHYSVGQEAIEEVKQRTKEAIDTTVIVLKRYQEHLVEQSS